MPATFYKYAERDADSQVNWSEVSKGLSDMLAETNKVREEKKTALDEAQRETMAYLAQTPNGEDKGARTAALEYADQASNRMRIAKQQMEQGQMSVKDYTIFRQNLVDNTNLLFNANKAYQEVYATKMQRNRDGISSVLEVDRMKDAEMFGDWANTGFYIGADGTVMAGKMTDKDVDGKKVRTLDQTPGNLRNIDTINQLILGDVDKYDYQSKVKQFVDNLGEEKQATAILGKIQQQGRIMTVEDITSRTDLLPGTKDILYKFINAENDKIKEIAGTDFDKARILMDSAILAPNNQPYTLTSDPKQAAKGVNYILKEYDPNTRGVVYRISKAQNEDVEGFIRNNMRSQYDYKEEIQPVSAVSRDEPSKDALDRKDKNKEDDNATSMIGKLWYGDNNQVQSSIDYFKGLKNKDGKVLFKDIVRNQKGITVKLSDGTIENISFLDANGRPKTQADFIASAGPLLAGQVDVKSSLERGAYVKDAKFNTKSTGRGTTIEEFKINPDVVSMSSQNAYKNIQAALPKGFKTKDVGGYTGNEVEITAPNGKKYVVKTKKSGEDAMTIAIGIEDFVRANTSSKMNAGKGKASKY